MPCWLLRRSSRSSAALADSGTSHIHHCTSPHATIQARPLLVLASQKWRSHPREIPESTPVCSEVQISRCPNLVVASLRQHLLCLEEKDGAVAEVEVYEMFGLCAETEVSFAGPRDP
jgi:hypothetical protein